MRENAIHECWFFGVLLAATQSLGLELLLAQAEWFRVAG